MLEEGIEPGGAIYPSQAGEKGAIIYFDTEDIDASVERVNELGGSAERSSPFRASPVPIPAAMQGQEASN
jgi:predicted enzyme related to lactoylglutathione lyase